MFYSMTMVIISSSSGSTTTREIISDSDAETLVLSRTAADAMTTDMHITNGITRTALMVIAAAVSASLVMLSVMPKRIGNKNEKRMWNIPVTVPSTKLPVAMTIMPEMEEENGIVLYFGFVMSSFSLESFVIGTA